MLLQASYAHLKKQQMTGVIANDEANQRLNQINASILELTQQIENGAASPNEVMRQLGHLNNAEVTKEMRNQAGNITKITEITDSDFDIEDSTGVVIGSGNTVNQTFTGTLSKWRFLAILGGLMLVIGIGYFGFSKVSSGQADQYESLSAIRAELKALAKDKGADSRLTKQIPDLESAIETGMKALNKKDYKSSIEYLEEVAEKAPLASVYKNLAYAYEQEGEFRRASKARNKAIKINPDAYTSKSYAELKGKRINLLLPEHGRKVLIASENHAEEMIDADFNTNSYGWVILEFGEGRTVTFDQIDCLVTINRSEFKVNVSINNDDPRGEFTSVAEFKTFKGFIKDKPFQDFKFSLVKAKYVKIEGNAFELRLWGKYE